MRKLLGKRFIARSGAIYVAFVSVGVALFAICSEPVDSVALRTGEWVLSENAAKTVVLQEKLKKRLLEAHGLLYAASANMESVITDDFFRENKDELDGLLAEFNQNRPSSPRLLLPDGADWASETDDEFFLTDDVRCEKNNPDAADLLSDILLARLAEQRAASPNAAKAAKAGIFRATCTLWPGGNVFYRLDDSVSPDMKSLVRECVGEWESATSRVVRFHEVPQRDSWAFLWAMGWSTHVLVSQGNTSGAGGITSFIGCSKWQRILLSDVSGAASKRVVLHEFGHVLGLNEEQRRYDRDDFVGVVWDNIKPEWRYSFWKIPWGFAWDTSKDYDLNSVMHYGPKAFSQDGASYVFTDSSGNYLKSCGGQEISPSDAALIVKVYGD
jgi:hypothetical protein